VEPIQPAKGPKRLSWEKIGNFLKTHWRDFAILFLLAGVIIALDQWTKAWVRANVPLGADWLPASLAWLEPYARIRHTYNTGAAFGLFQQGGLIFAILAVVVSVLIISYFPQTSRRDWWLRLALALQLGGALGNLVDRIARSGKVTDFISVGNFAIFNVADSCISVGVAILILGVWLMERKLKKEEKAKQLEATSE
jgi:signal peptidase II